MYCQPAPIDTPKNISYMQMAFQNKRLSLLYLKTSCLAYLSFLTLTIAFVKVEDTQCGLKDTFHVYAEENVNL